MERTKL
jgi:hypothetical protein